MVKRTLVIATRESPLALWQANWVKNQLLRYHPHLDVQLLGMTTTADQLLSISLKDAGGKGLFVKELEEALLNGSADIAVHSMKDVPMELPQGLALSVVCEREDPRDVFVSNRYKDLLELPPQSIVGTSSLRRESQLKVMRPDLLQMNLRGNVGTRLKKLDSGEYDALILAAAGLKRLGLAHRITDYFSTQQMLPAAGQGILGIECRDNDHSILELIQPLNDKKTAWCVSAERALCKRLGGGCQNPIAAYATIFQDKLKLEGVIASQDGKILLRCEEEVAIVKNEDSFAVLLGQTIAEALLAKGADKIIQSYINNGNPL